MSKKTKETTTPEIDDTTAAPMSDDDSENMPENEQETQGGTVDDFLKNPDVLAYIETQISEGIKKALQGTPPKANTADLTEQEYKQFEKMTYKERLNLFKSNPQTYYKLTKGEKQ